MFKLTLFIALFLFTTTYADSVFNQLSDPDFDLWSGLAADEDPVTGGGSCTSKANGCSDHGECIKSNASSAIGTCDCEEQYVKADCSYEQKSRLVAFLLSFFLGGFGAGRFYLGEVWQPILKLVLSLLVCCTGCGVQTLAAKVKQDNQPAYFALTFFACCFCCGSWVWIVIDWVLIGTGSLGDANGYPTFADM